MRARERCVDERGERRDGNERERGPPQPPAERSLNLMRTRETGLSFRARCAAALSAAEKDTRRPTQNPPRGDDKTGSLYRRRRLLDGARFFVKDAVRKESKPFFVRAFWGGRGRFSIFSVRGRPRVVRVACMPAYLCAVRGSRLCGCPQSHAPSKGAWMDQVERDAHIFFIPPLFRGVPRPSLPSAARSLCREGGLLVEGGGVRGAQTNKQGARP